MTSEDVLSSELSLFSNVNATVRRISNIAEKHSVNIAQSIKLTENHYKNDSLEGLEAFLSKNSSHISNGSAISVLKCESLSDEAEFAARTIRKLVREEGYRYRDFVIIARNAEAYQKYVLKHCKNNDVFCFSDKRKKITDLPFSVLINCALNLSEAITTDDVLSFHKTFLTDLTVEEISQLENYTYLWNLKGSEWIKEWTMNPEGFLADEKDSENKHFEVLRQLNDLRNKAIKPIIRFREAFCGNAEKFLAKL